MRYRIMQAVAVIAGPVVCIGLAGCGPRGSSTTSASEPLAHTGSVDGYNFEMYGDSKARVERVPDLKGAGSYPKVTCGSNWFSIRDKWLVVNGRDYGTVVKPGDTVKVDADGKLFVNGRQVAPLPPQPPAPVPNQGPDVG